MIELLSPGGSLDKLKYAVLFGADAVYASGKDFGLRAKSANLSDEEIVEAVNFCHQSGKKLYITVNIFARNDHLGKLRDHIRFLSDSGVDAVIVSDPGVFLLVRETDPALPVHISTQANVTSASSAEFWYRQGAKRIILARELSYAEIRLIRKELPDLELEMFVHGAMCMAYSGRCLLSMFLNDRNPNLGNCSQPCRWKYQLREESRPGEFFDLIEDEQGSYILNSRDLCLIARLSEIISAGVDSVKIEGRMKSIYYTANLSRTYRKALDLTEKGKSLPDRILAEVDKVSHRVYTEGFFDQKQSGSLQHYSSSSYVRDYQFIGTVLPTEDGWTGVSLKAGVSRNDRLEIIYPDFDRDIESRVEQIKDKDGNLLERANPNTSVKILLHKNAPTPGIVRKRKEEK